MSEHDTEEPEEYLGDGVYIKIEVTYGLGRLLLYTSNGIDITNRIYLEGSVTTGLIDFINKYRE